MEELLQNWMSNSSLPVTTAFILGLLTAISPCPLATNITAIGFIGRDVEDKRKVFINGLIYTAGRAIAYTLLAFIRLLKQTVNYGEWVKQLAGDSKAKPSSDFKSKF